MLQTSQNILHFGKICAIVLTIVTIWSIASESALAASCRSIAERRVCIETIQRSAKNYWQYRTTISVDGIRQSVATYDCRDRLIYGSQGKITAFADDPTGKIVCQLYRR
jgi:hypothetical protein